MPTWVVPASGGGWLPGSASKLTRGYGSRLKPPSVNEGSFATKRTTPRRLARSGIPSSFLIVGSRGSTGSRLDDQAGTLSLHPSAHEDARLEALPLSNVSDEPGSRGTTFESCRGIPELRS